MFLCSLGTYEKSEVHPSRKRQSELHLSVMFQLELTICALHLTATACFFHFEFCFRKETVHLKANLKKKPTYFFILYLYFLYILYYFLYFILYNFLLLKKKNIFLMAQYTLEIRLVHDYSM